MERSQIDALIAEYGSEEAIERMSQLMNEEYDEYLMLKLAEAYQGKGELKEAKKIVRKLQRLFPAGDYITEAEDLMNTLSGALENEAWKQFPDEVVTGMMADTGKEGREKKSSGKENNEERESGKKNTKKEDRERKDTKKEDHEKQETQKEDYEKQDAKKGDSEKKDAKEKDSGKKDNKKENAGKRQDREQLRRNIHDFFADTVGLGTVERELEKFHNLLQLQNARKQNNFQADLLGSTHFAILGGQAAGKTLTAHIIARVLCSFGLHSDGREWTVDADEFLRAYCDGADRGVRNLFSTISNGTVIVENMHNINHSDWVKPMEKLMQDRKSDLSIIITGDPKIRSRFSEESGFLKRSICTIEIPPYSAEELLYIAEKLAKERALRIHPDARKSLLYKIERQCGRSDFMNAISLGEIFDEAVQKMADRYDAGSASESDMVTLMPEDFNTETGEGLEELLARLDAMTGLASVKEQIRKRVDAIAVVNAAREAGAPRKDDNGSLHMVFTGNPGTGKTTVARLIGKIYRQLGVLSRGDNVVECTRKDLVGEYLGWTAKAVQKKVEEALGGVLFIDEAYSLVNGEHDAFGKEAVNELIAAIENNRDDMLVILAGYPEEMDEFLDSNPGFRSRIRNKILFEDYSADEMTEIFKGMIKGQNMQLDEEAEALLHQFIVVKSKVPDFGNARGVRNLVQDVIEVQNARLNTLRKDGKELTGDQYVTICAEDLQKLSGGSLTGDQSLQELLDQLDELTGLTSVKKKVREMVNGIKVKEFKKKHGMESEDGHGTLHLVFKGNAGTGKTTVARLLGQIYKELGVLSKNVFVEAGRKDLVGRYMGHTPGKVMKKIREAEGGILFIDEAYSLVNGEHDEYGMEAINTLVAEMENRRDNLMVIVAGYPREMDYFLDANQGLASRLSNEILFEDYTMDEMFSIFEYMVREKGMLLAPGLEKDVRELLEWRKSAVTDFGNARGVRNIVEELKRKMETRIAGMIDEGKEWSADELRTLVKEDFEEMKAR